MRTLAKIQKWFDKPLNGDYVEERRSGYGSVDYIPSWYAIALANRAFGEQSWDRRTVGIDHRLDYENDKGTMVATATATVEVTVRFIQDGEIQSITRQGTGQGQGFGDERVGDAFKTAESDATKRALMTFGDLFGLSLYRGEGDLQLNIPWFTSEEKSELRKYVRPYTEEADKGEIAELFTEASRRELSVEETKNLFDEQLG